MTTERIRAVLTGIIEYEAGLDALTILPASEVNPALTQLLREAFETRWRGGWQPVELHRVVARRGLTLHADLVTDAVAEHLRRFPADAVDERWRAQAEALGAHVWWTDSYFDELATRFKLDRTEVLDLALTLLGVLARLPRVQVLVPPPGSVPVPHPHHGIDPRLLHRVRSLLAKAESTTHAAEAEAYTAKVQELVTRHSLDKALLAAKSGDVEVVPFAKRIGVDHPYEGEKATLLNAIAGANRCHAVWSPELGFATVFGFDGDIDAVDLLYTSLLVQAHRVMAQTEPPGGKAGRARLRSYRQSFLVAFAVRIGERLTAAAAAAVAPVETAALVLASRDEQVREAMRLTFPRTVRSRGVRIDSDEGWDSGHAAADQAALGGSGS